MPTRVALDTNVINSWVRPPGKPGKRLRPYTIVGWGSFTGRAQQQAVGTARAIKVKVAAVGNHAGQQVLLAQNLWGSDDGTNANSEGRRKRKTSSALPCPAK